MRSLVTGGAGFIGCHVADALLKSGHDVTVLDDLSGGNRENVPVRAKFVQGSVLDHALIDRLFKENRFDYVFHLAAYAAEGLSHFIKRFNHENNLIGSVNLINASVNHNVKRFIFTSSIAVYGASQMPAVETTQPRPEDSYGIAKYAVEMELEATHRMFGLDYTVFRPHNVYGENQNIGDRYRNVIDIFIDLAWDIDTMSLLDWCHHNGVRYINTSIELWEPYKEAENRHPTDFTLYVRHMALRKMIASWKNPKGPTMIIDHGANPGLVSHFTKQALLDIASRILKEKPRDPRREAFEKALANEDFPRLAFLAGVKVIHISERDTQITNKPKEVNEFVNTWSIPGLIEEAIAPSEIGWGTHERHIPKGALGHKSGPRNQICLRQKGMHTWVRSWVPAGEITGMVIRHGEAFSISEYLTLWHKDKVTYRPTVHYAYCLPDVAVNSLHEFEMRGYNPQPRRRIMQDEIISGEDQLGCLLMGHDFKSWWTGSVLSIDETRRLVPGQNATTLQVAISVVAAVIYMIKNPELGFHLPDYLDHKEILKIAKPYLGQMVSKPVDWTPLQSKLNRYEYNGHKPDLKDHWQFMNFLVHPMEKEPSPLTNGHRPKRTATLAR